MVYCDPITSLSDLKENVERRVRNILQSASFNCRICDFTLPDGSRQWWTSYQACFVNFKNYLYVFNKLMLCHLGGIFGTHWVFFPSIKFPSFHFAITGGSQISSLITDILYSKLFKYFFISN